MMDKDQTDYDFLDDDESDEELQAGLRALRAASGSPSTPQAKPEAKPEPRRPPWSRGPTLDPSIGTEMLLNNMIAECHSVMRDLAIPLAAEAPDPYSCRQFLSETVSLVPAGGLSAKAGGGLGA